MKFILKGKAILMLAKYTPNEAKLTVQILGKEGIKQKHWFCHVPI